MSRLKNRVFDLEQRRPENAKQWVRILQHEDQTREQAIAAYEAECGPIDDKGVVLRVFISKPFPTPAAA